MRSLSPRKEKSFWLQPCKLDSCQKDLNWWKRISKDFAPQQHFFEQKNFHLFHPCRMSDYSTVTSYWCPNVRCFASLRNAFIELFGILGIQSRAAYNTEPNIIAQYYTRLNLQGHPNVAMCCNFCQIINLYQIIAIINCHDHPDYWKIIGRDITSYGSNPYC